MCLAFQSAGPGKLEKFKKFIKQNHTQRERFVLICCFAMQSRIDHHQTDRRLLLRLTHPNAPTSLKRSLAARGFSSRRMLIPLQSNPPCQILALTDAVAAPGHSTRLLTPFQSDRLPENVQRFSAGFTHVMPERNQPLCVLSSPQSFLSRAFLGKMASISCQKKRGGDVPAPSADVASAMEQLSGWQLSNFDSP